ncbi:MAG TPA: FAD-binding oxidoreductase [Gaiellaceae bacterium]
MSGSQGVDVCVVGGGLVGTSTAYFAAKAGLSVTLLEAGDLACGASGAAFGGVSASIFSYADTRVPHHYVALSLASIELYHELADALGPPLDFEVSGEIDPYFDPAETESRRQRIEALSAAGVPVELLTPDELRTIEPELSSEIAGGSWCPIGGAVTPQNAVWALADGARAHGAEIVTGARVERIETAGGAVTGVRTADRVVPADRVIVCGGKGTSALLETVGIPIPIELFRRQLFVSERLPPLIRTALHNVKQTMAGTVVFGVTRNAGGPVKARVADVTAPMQQDLAHSAIQLFPALATARVLRFWAGLIVVPGDGYPVIGAVPGLEGAYVGVLNRGVTIGPLAGQLLAGLAAGETSSHDLEPYRVGRFGAGASVLASDGYYSH